MTRIKSFMFAAALLLLSPLAALAQNAYPVGSSGGPRAPVEVPVCIDSTGAFAVPCSASNAVPLSQTPTPSALAAAALSHASTTALGVSLVVKASAGNLYGYNCSAIAGAAAGMCIAYNQATVPGTGALTGALVLDFCFIDTTARGCSLSRIPMGVQYSAGIVILLSSAASPYTYTTGVLTGAITADFK